MRHPTGGKNPNTVDSGSLTLQLFFNSYHPPPPSGCLPEQAPLSKNRSSVLSEVIVAPVQSCGSAGDPGLHPHCGRDTHNPVLLHRSGNAPQVFRERLHAICSTSETVSTETGFLWPSSNANLTQVSHGNIKINSVSF